MNKLNAILDSLARMSGNDRNRRLEGKCIHCNQDAEGRCTTEAGRREYLISGFCEICFDKCFEDKE